MMKSKVEIVKKAIAVFMSLVLVVLAGCTVVPALKTEIPDDEESVLPRGFEEADIPSAYLKEASYITTNDDMVVFLSNVWVDDSEEPVERNDDDGEDDKYHYNQYVIKYDIKAKKFNRFSLDNCPIKEIWGLELTEDDTVLVYSNSEKINAFYDLDMNFIEKTERNVPDDTEFARKSKFYTDHYGSVYNGYCVIESCSTLFAYFENDLDTIYSFSCEKPVSISAYNKKEDLILCSSSDNKCMSFTVNDYKNSIVLNSADVIPTDYEYDGCSIENTCLGNKYAACNMYFYMDSNYKNFTYKLLLWDYNENADTQRAEIRPFTYSELEKSANDIKASIEDQFGVSVFINEADEYIKDIVKCDASPDIVILYDNLVTVRNFFKSLPEGMIGEVASYAGGSGTDSGIRLSIVSEITQKNTDAFANAYVVPMEMCFSFISLNKANLAHEFMHLLELGIDSYFSSIDGEYTDDWSRINKGFEHEYNANEDTHPQYDFDEKQFITDYACTNDTEDRAVTFEYLYMNAGMEKEKLENPAIKKKADTLKSQIRSAFPSVHSTDAAIWET